MCDKHAIVDAQSRGGLPGGPTNLIHRCYRQSPDIRFHDLRHTAASLMLNHGVAPIIVSRRLEHSRVSITLDTYGHLMPVMQGEAAGLMDKLINPISIKLPTTAHDPVRSSRK